MALLESGQMYLETIYVLLQKKSKVRAIDVANCLGYSKPSVSRAIGLLKSGEHIIVDESGYITLTSKGEEIAMQLYERHTVITQILTFLGIDEETATQDACRIEHVISDKSFVALKKHYEEYKKSADS